MYKRQLQAIVTDQEDGWLTPVDDPAALAKAMTLMLRAEPLRHELAVNGRQTLSTRHSEATIVNAYLDLYQRLFAA